MNKSGGPSRPKFSSKQRSERPDGPKREGGKVKRKPKPFSTARPREEGGPKAKVAAAPKAPKSESAILPGHVTVTLARGKSKPFWVGHPWVFSGAIDSVSREVEGGAPCVVEDERKNPLGTGYYSPEGQIAVRLLWHRRSTDLPFQPPSFEALLDERLNQAIALRVELGLPGERTNVFRLVNAEGDFLPGLIVDRLGDVTSVQIGSRQMLENRDIIVALLKKKLPTSRTVISVTETASRLEGIPVTLDFEPAIDKASRHERAHAEIREDGLRYRVDLESIQKTGFYADQRENRRRFAALCPGRTMLDAYCHHGGFGLQAARAGASHVTQVDTSAPAIEGARAAAELNGLSAKVEGLVADAIVYLKESQAAGKTWDRIVIDPPKLAQGRSHLEDALQKYARLNTLAMATLGKGGLLLTNSCSRHVSEEEFGRMLTESGHRLRKSVRILERWGQPSDHPTLSVAPEGRYLKSWLVSLGD
jgi:23S rRNA (cytosine1962-C5)-methyltransferase